MTRRTVTYLALLVALGMGASAQNDAGRESPFSLGIGARALSLGSGFTALADDASLLYYNPAGLSFLSNQEVSFMHATLFEGTNYNFAGWVVPIGDRSGTGIGVMRIGTDNIIGRENFVVTDTSSFSHTQIVFAYANKLSNRLSLGGNFKVINQSFGSLSDFAYAGDLGLMGRITNSLSIGLIARDLITPDLKLDSISEKSPRSFTLGAALNKLSLSDQLQLSITADLEKINDRDPLFHGGAEALFSNRYAIRAGLDKSNISLGAGLQVAQLRIDYAYRAMDILGDSHRFSLTWLLGVPKQAEPIIIDRMIEPEPIVLTEEQQVALAAKQTAHRFFQNSELDSALHYYRVTLEHDPADEEARRMIAAIETTLEAEKHQRQVEQEQFTDRYYHQAYQFYNKRFYSAASDLLALILEIDPGYSRASDLMSQIDKARQDEISSLMARADSAKAESRLVDEITTYNRILEIKADLQSVIDAKAKAQAGLDMTQQLNLGIRLYTQGRYHIARRHFEAVLRANSSDEVALDYIEKIKGALAGPSSLEELQQNKEIWELYLNGIRSMRKAEYQKAIDDWEKILEVFPNNVNTLNNLEQARLRLQAEKGQ